MKAKLGKICVFPSVECAEVAVLGWRITVWCVLMFGESASHSLPKRTQSMNWNFFSFHGIVLCTWNIMKLWISWDVKSLLIFCNRKPNHSFVSTTQNWSSESTMEIEEQGRCKRALEEVTPKLGLSGNELWRHKMLVVPFPSCWCYNKTNRPTLLYSQSTLHHQKKCSFQMHSFPCSHTTWRNIRLPPTSSLIHSNNITLLCLKIRVNCCSQRTG